MFVRPSVRLGRACIVTIRYTLARISVYGWVVQCSRHPGTKACPPTLSRLFPVMEERWGMNKCELSVKSQERLKIEVKLLLIANRNSYNYAASIGTTTDDLE